MPETKASTPDIQARLAERLLADADLITCTDDPEVTMDDVCANIIATHLRQAAAALAEREPVTTHDFRDRQKRGLRIAVAWLHARAKAMTDPHAQQVLNSAATNLGWETDELAGIKKVDVYEGPSREPVNADLAKSLREWAGVLAGEADYQERQRGPEDSAVRRMRPAIDLMRKAADALTTLGGKENNNA